MNMTFTEYIEEIKNTINVSKDISNKSDVAKIIRNINLTEDEISINFDYFTDLFSAGKTPIDAILSLKQNEDCLYRLCSKFTDSIIVDEVTARGLENDVLTEMDTDDIEWELDKRYDASYIKLSQADDDTLINELRDRGYNEIEIGYNDNRKAIICQALNLNNSFAYTDDEIVDALINFLKR